LAAAFVIAQEMENNQVIVIQETEYTGAGKHLLPQLSFARKNGIEIRIGRPQEEVAGVDIVLPEHPSKLVIKEMDLNSYRKSYITNAIKNQNISVLESIDIDFLCEETRLNRLHVLEILSNMKVYIR
jgi:2-amino-4-ketopentanoate thiolase beta subunit